MKGITAEPPITHTLLWTGQAMGYQGLWLCRGMLKIDSRNQRNFAALRSIEHGCVLEYALSDVVYCRLQPQKQYNY